MENFNDIKSAEVCAFLDNLGVRYEFHRRDDGEFKYLKESEVSVKIPNPYAERTMFVDFQNEISLFFGEEWHEHYYPNDDDINEFYDTLKGILENVYCSAAVFIYRR